MIGEESGELKRRAALLQRIVRDNNDLDAADELDELIAQEQANGAALEVASAHGKPTRWTPEDDQFILENYVK